MVLSVRRRIADIARAEPDRTALVGFDTDLAEQVLSWREVADRVADAADALRAALDRRTRSCAVVLAGNTLPAAIGIAAALTAGVPVFPLNPGTPPAERDALLGLLGRRFAHAYLMDAQLRPQRIDLPAGQEPPVAASAVAYLLATGASTGIPKISARPGPLRYDPVRTPSVVIRQTGWRTAQRQLIVGPLYHAAPFTRSSTPCWTATPSSCSRSSRRSGRSS
jgi:bile acid-coenzyme A ligase